MLIDSIDMSKSAKERLGTGPGVIQMDGYTPGYSNNMGRPRTHMNQGVLSEIVCVLIKSWKMNVPLLYNKDNWLRPSELLSYCSSKLRCMGVCWKRGSDVGCQLMTCSLVSCHSRGRR